MEINRDNKFQLLNNHGKKGSKIEKLIEILKDTRDKLKNTEEKRDSSLLQINSALQPENVDYCTSMANVQQGQNRRGACSGRVGTVLRGRFGRREHCWLPKQDRQLTILNERGNRHRL